MPDIEDQIKEYVEDQIRGFVRQTIREQSPDVLAQIDAHDLARDAAIAGTVARKEPLLTATVLRRPTDPSAAAISTLRRDYADIDPSKAVDTFVSRKNLYADAIDLVTQRSPRATILDRYATPERERELRAAIAEVATSEEFKGVHPNIDRSYLGKLGEQISRGAGDLTKAGAFIEQINPGGDPDAVRRMLLEGFVRDARQQADPAGTADEDPFYLRLPAKAARSIPVAAGAIAGGLAAPVVGLPTAVGGGAVFAAQAIPDAFQDYTARGMAPEWAGLAAAVSGSIEAAVEQFIPTERLLGMKGVGGATGLREIVGKVATEYAKVTAGETGEELTQNAIREITDSVFEKGFSAETLADLKSKIPNFREFVGQVAETAGVAATMALPGGGVNVARETLASRWGRENVDAALSLPTVPSRVEYESITGKAVSSADERQAFAEEAKRAATEVPPAQQEAPQAPVETSAETIQAPEAEAPVEPTVDIQPEPSPGVAPEAQDQEIANGEDQVEAVEAPDAEGQGQEEVLLDEQANDPGPPPTPPFATTTGGGPSPTSIKNAQVDIERERRGLPPVVKEARRSWGAAWDAAMREIDADPTLPERTAQSFIDNPHAADDREDMLLLHRQITLQNEYDATIEAAVEATRSGDPAAIAATMEAEKLLRSKLEQVYEADKISGRETGRGLNARKMMRTTTTRSRTWSFRPSRQRASR